jgi:hypothetical protein
VDVLCVSAGEPRNRSSLRFVEAYVQNSPRLRARNGNERMRKLDPNDDSGDEVKQTIGPGYGMVNPSFDLQLGTSQFLGLRFVYLQ